MATKKTGTKTPKGWTPQMQFSKRIARTVIIYWLMFVSSVFTVLVIYVEIDALLALTGWVTAVMITMVGAYTGNSIYEKHLDKGLGKGFYLPKGQKQEPEDEEENAENEGNG